jgi:hypothetical protein
MWFNESLFTQTNTNIFVFGSNLAGRHGAGAAKFARTFCGAIYGQGMGFQGKSFAIPTKDEMLKTLPLDAIESFVRQFLHFATQNPQLTFYITPIGTGLAGYQHHQIAPMFRDAPLNCKLPSAWQIRNEIPLLDVDKATE